MNLTVIICTYNPNIINLELVLSALKEQTLVTTYWKLIVIDNKSEPGIKDLVDLSWHPNHRIVREEKIGLLNARATGYRLAGDGLILFVDDDNQLDPGYLNIARDFHLQHPEVGSFGGKSIAVYEKQPPAWFSQTGISLGCQDHGENEIISTYQLENFSISEYPHFAPIGTGMAVTTSAMGAYLKDIEGDLERSNLGRSGNSLYSGEDNDMNITFIKKGYEIAYVPDMIVKHLIPPGRLTTEYLSRMSYNSAKSWIKLLYAHRLYSIAKIPKWTVMLRKTKAWLTYKAWKSPLNYILWRGACGTFEALSELHE